MKKKVRALALFSGGLDSALAIKVITNQGVEVIALNFVSHFFGGKNEKAEAMAKQLGVKLEYVDFSQKHIEILKNPVYGRGKNMNPCIDCHALMFRFAGELLEKYDADFLISGEVLGQRPMSQNYQALEKVKGLTQLEDLIVRPLSAKLLPPSKPELEGLIDREQLLDIQSRQRALHDKKDFRQISDDIRYVSAHSLLCPLPVLRQAFSLPARRLRLLHKNYNSPQAVQLIRTPVKPDFPHTP